MKPVILYRASAWKIAWRHDDDGTLVNVATAVRRAYENRYGLEGGKVATHHVKALCPCNSYICVSPDHVTFRDASVNAKRKGMDAYAVDKDAALILESLARA